MKRAFSSHIRTNYSYFLVALCIIFSSSALYAQSPADFSGVWIQDSIKSDDFYKSFDVKYTIRQTDLAFEVEQTFSLKNSTESITRNYTFTLDGKVTTMQKEGKAEKNSAQWSADKKILTTRSTVAYGTQDVGFNETYSLSADGLVLTAKKSDIIPGATTVTMVFNKKK